jgi:DNA-binding MarR family transcriptional regulator
MGYPGDEAGAGSADGTAGGGTAAGADAAGAADVGTAEAVLEVEEQMNLLANVIRAKARRAAAEIHPALPPFGLKMLRLLARRGPTRASTVAEVLQVDRSVISRHVKVLEELHLIELLVDESDGRARRLAVSPVARERMDRVLGTGRTLVHQELATWSASDLHDFAGYIQRLNAPDE